jgi:hypothetical protein
MSDLFQYHEPNLDSPARDVFAITKSDATVFTISTRAIYVGTGGDLAVRMISGNSATFTNVPDGTILPLRCDKVLETGTDASEILGLI